MAEKCKFFHSWGDWYTKPGYSNWLFRKCVSCGVIDTKFVNKV